MKKAKQLFVFAVGVVIVMAPTAAFATPYDSGTYDTGSYDGTGDTLSISSDGNVNVPLHPGGGATLATNTSHVTVTTDDVDGYKLYVHANSNAELSYNATSTSQGNVTVDKSATHNVNGKTNTLTGFTTTYANDLIVVFIGSDGPSTTNGQSVSSVTSSGLTFTRIAQSRVSYGVVEAWAAQASSILSNASIAVATSASSNWYQSMSVFAFKDAHVGASATNGTATSGAPTVSLTTTDTKSMVYGLGHDYSTSTARTIGSGQTMFYEYQTPSGDDIWTQYKTAAVPTSGTVVTLNDTAPTGDVFDFAAVEIIPNHVVNNVTVGTIPASSNSTPAALATNTWGYNIDGSSNFVGLTTSDVLAHQATAAATSGDVTTFTYGVNADNRVVPGSYTTTVVYTAVPAT